jgi:hypothetical protein
LTAGLLTDALVWFGMVLRVVVLGNMRITTSVPNVGVVSFSLITDVTRVDRWMRMSTVTPFTTKKGVGSKSLPHIQI